MKNDKTGEVHITRDVKWMNGKDKEIFHRGNLEINDNIEDQIDEVEELDHEIIFELEEENEEDGPLFKEMDPERERLAQRLTREVRNLRSYNNPG